MPLPPVSHHDGQCLDGGTSATVRVQLPPGSHNISWSPLPALGSGALGFVVAKALIALAPGCVAPAGLTPNADDGPGTPRNLWVGRVSELTLPLALNRCGCGVAIYASGSGGSTGDNLRQMRQLAAVGYSTIGPDTMAGAPAGAPAAYPRHRDLVDSVSRAVGATDSYWCANDVYSSGCVGAAEGGAYPGCFDSNATEIRYDPAGWARLYERVYAMRARELDTLLAAFEASFGRPSRLLLHGNSEGAMVVSRYSHPLLARYGLAGRILTAWSCEYVYFVSCDASADLGAPLVPVLNLLSASDPYFGAVPSSVASAVAAPGRGGYGGPVTGSCAARMRRQGVRGASLRLLEPYHDTLEQVRSLERSPPPSPLTRPTLHAPAIRPS